MSYAFGPRRGIVIDIADESDPGSRPLTDDELSSFEFFDLVYRSLCAVLYNYVPGSGHPGGSISSGRYVQAIFFETLECDLSNPEESTADILSYAAGHKALGLYSVWALRNEVARICRPDLLAPEERF